MGMLLHHTWLEQQKAEKHVAEEKKTEEVKETKEPDAEPVKRTGGRRKTNK